MIVIVRRSDLPPDFDGSKTPLPILSFGARTVVGIVAGAHRLVALIMYCDEADKVIDAANKYIDRLRLELHKPGQTSDQHSECRAILCNLVSTVNQLIKERNDVAHWPTLVYDWGE